MLQTVSTHKYDIGVRCKLQRDMYGSATDVVNVRLQQLHYRIIVRLLRRSSIDIQYVDTN